MMSLLDEVEKVFTKDDNDLLTASPTKDEVFKVLKKANHSAAPITDGILIYLYFKCFELLGDAITAVIKVIHRESSPTPSQRSNIMVFIDKPRRLVQSLSKTNVL